MAGVGGFEPPNAGIKTRCLATWRHPSSRLDQAALWLTVPSYYLVTKHRAESLQVSG